MLNFLTYVHGNKTWLPTQYNAPDVKPADAVATTLRRSLGTDSLQNCIALYRICCAHQMIAQHLPKETTSLDFAGLLFPATVPATVIQGELTTTGNAPGYFLPVPTAPGKEKAITLTCISESKATLAFNGKKMVVTAVLGNPTTLVVQWPEDLPINGSVKLPDGFSWLAGSSIAIPTRYAYDVNNADKALRSDVTVYDALEKQNLCAAYYSADTPEERIGICILLLIAHTKQ